ncbi:MAG: cation transporter, partial [Gammaproteobacteria bacterium]
MPHSHAHHHAANRLLWAMSLTAIFMVVEVFGGIFSGSLALMADAGHMLTDTASLFIAW